MARKGPVKKSSPLSERRKVDKEKQEEKNKEQEDSKEHQKESSEKFAEFLSYLSTIKLEESKKNENKEVRAALEKRDNKENKRYLELRKEWIAVEGVDLEVKKMREPGNFSLFIKQKKTLNFVQFYTQKNLVGRIAVKILGLRVFSYVLDSLGHIQWKIFRSRRRKLVENPRKFQINNLDKVDARFASIYLQET